MLKRVSRSVVAGVLVWVAVTLVALPTWGESDGDGDGDTSGPAAGAPGSSSAGGPPRSSSGGRTTGSEQPEDEDAPSTPAHDGASDGLEVDPYALDPYEGDRPEAEAGIPAELRSEPAASAGDPDDSSPADPYATDPYGDSTE